MRNKLGISCMTLGVIFIIAACFLLIRNFEEDKEAGNASDAIVEQLEEQVKKKNTDNQNSTDNASTNDINGVNGINSNGTLASGENVQNGGAIGVAENVSPQSGSYEANSPNISVVDQSIPGAGLGMSETRVDGRMYIGYLYIQALSLKLPVMSNWSYPNLRIAPCRYAGSTKTDDFVILAHNYARHFGRLKDLSIGETVFFTDMDGTLFQYEVMAVEVLPPNAVMDMIDGAYDLTLFTCTYGGQSRVAVRCERIEG